MLKTNNDKRGEHSRVIGDKNRERIMDYFKENPLSNGRQCAKVLGLSEFTVHRHLKVLRAGKNG